MGALDEAIREHLELKRKLGATEEELKAKEDEAFGHGKPLPPPVETAVEVEDAASPEPQPKVFIDDLSADTAEQVAEPQPIEPDPVAPEAAVEVVEAPVPTEDFEPDEVLPEESLEPEPETAASTEDVLEETPEFLEQSSDQDRLWFEQKPPKDFDFDD